MDARLSSDTERWFVRRGIPHFIHAYSATEDVFTRAAPFLVAVLLGETFLVFGDRFSGFGQAAAFAAGLAVILAVAVLVNRLRGRPALSLPDDVGWAEIGAFVLAPVLVRQIAEPGLVALAWGVLLQVAILAVVFVVTSYGIVPMMRWAVAHFLRRLTTLASLMVRVLPLMLVFSLFLFVNAEVWQVADDMRLAYFVIIMSAFAVIGLAFIAWSIDGETGDIARLESWDEAAALAADSPMASACPRGQARPEVPPLSRAERANLLMVLIVSRLAPVIIVTAFGTVESAVAAMREGAADYLLKPGGMAVYEALLAAMAQRRGCYHALPRDVAGWWRRRAAFGTEHASRPGARPALDEAVIWKLERRDNGVDATIPGLPSAPRIVAEGETIP